MAAVVGFIPSNDAPISTTKCIEITAKLRLQTSTCSPVNCRLPDIGWGVLIVIHCPLYTSVSFLNFITSRLWQLLFGRVQSYPAEILRHDPGRHMPLNDQPYLVVHNKAAQIITVDPRAALIQRHQPTSQHLQLSFLRLQQLTSTLKTSPLQQCCSYRSSRICSRLIRSINGSQLRKHPLGQQALLELENLQGARARSLGPHQNGTRQSFTSTMSCWWE